MHGRRDVELKFTACLFPEDALDVRFFDDFFGVIVAAVDVRLEQLGAADVVPHFQAHHHAIAELTTTGQFADGVDEISSRVHCGFVCIGIGNRSISFSFKDKIWSIGD